MDEEHQDPYDESERNYEQYLKERDELLKRQLSNSQLFDKAILALSSAGLGFSLAFMRRGISLAEATQVYLLYSSWLLFVVAIISTLASFLTSQGAIKKQLEINEADYVTSKYYLANNEDSSNPKNWLDWITTGLGWMSIISYTGSPDYPSLLTETAYNKLHESVRYADDRRLMWEPATWTDMNGMLIYRSTWRWRI